MFGILLVPSSLRAFSDAGYSRKCMTSALDDRFGAVTSTPSCFETDCGSDVKGEPASHLLLAVFPVSSEIRPNAADQAAAYEA